MVFVMVYVEGAGLGSDFVARGGVYVALIFRDANAEGRSVLTASMARL